MVNKLNTAIGILYNVKQLFQLTDNKVNKLLFLRYWNEEHYNECSAINTEQ